jgi:F-type H+-transporting ATPase subunit gamma
VATLREIRQRISGIKNIQKITKAMKMVASAKLRRAQEAILSTRPYALKMGSLMSSLVSKVDPSMHPLFAPRPVHTVALVVVTSDRGLCGAFNTNLLRAAVLEYQKLSKELETSGGSVQLITVGKKGTDFFVKRDYPVAAKHPGIFSDLHWGVARTIMDTLTVSYLKGGVDRVVVLYNEFKSVIQQRIVSEQLLPVPPEQIEGAEPSLVQSQVDYIYEPSGEAIINALVPRHLSYQMWRVLLESNAAEQGARRTAMDNATSNASELIGDLTLSYNKARQASITKELLEIVSGAEALKQSD